MSESVTTLTRTITLSTPDEALRLFGAGDVNLRRMRELSAARITSRGDTISIQGESAQVEAAMLMVQDALALVRSGSEVTPDAVTRVSRLSTEGRSLSAETQGSPVLPRGLKAKTPGQKLYLEQIEKSDITFGVGPAGTGKTYLAVAMAVNALKAKRVKRIILTRPAVEAGEKLGFLPGDL